MSRDPGLRALIALAAGVLAWNALFQILFFTGGAASIELVVITAVAVATMVIVFRGPRLRAMMAIAAGVFAWKALLQLLFYNGGPVTQMVVITALSAAFTALVFHAFPKARAPTVH